MGPASNACEQLFVSCASVEAHTKRVQGCSWGVQLLEVLGWVRGDYAFCITEVLKQVRKLGDSH